MGLSDLPTELRYNRSKSEWCDSHSFEYWFTTVFIPSASKLEGVKVIIDDNLSSHFTVNVIKLAAQNNVRFSFCPPQCYTFNATTRRSIFCLTKTSVAQYIGWPQNELWQKSSNTGQILLKHKIYGQEDKSGNLVSGFENAA